MRQRILLFLLLMVSCLPAKATHIVGGEFELQHQTGYNYRLKLNLYFDDVNGDPGALDQTITAHIFEKGSNRLMTPQGILMPITSQSFVPYTNIDCTVGSLRTRRIVYQQDILLDQNRFNNPAGYYVTWERCCRNHTITNIERPQDAAQTFYLEFPPVVQQGTFFKNSSPILFPPLSDYACVNELFYFEFNGTDPDGDSLVYDMVSPLNGYTSPDMPAYISAPRSAPYPEIKWLTGYGTTLQVPGSPPIRIDRKTGQLTMRPAQKGLFVFGVRCQEFRNGAKIGEVRRDFQVLVLDCPRNQTPAVVAKEQHQGAFYQEGELLRISATGNRCLDVYFTDPDVSEFVTLRLRPVNFSQQDFTFQGPTSGVLNQSAARDSLKATLCFADCFDTAGKTYLLDLIVEDDGCSLPRQDTLRLSIVAAPHPDSPPVISLSTVQRVFEVAEGDTITFDVLGQDTDNDVVTLTAQGQNFDIGAQSISFEPTTGAGQVRSPFSWPIDCPAMQQDTYKLDFAVSSTVCNKTITRTETIEVKPKRTNRTPVISSDKTVLVFDLALDEAFQARIFGQDLDLNTLILSASGDGFSLSEAGMRFTSKAGAGNATGTFEWVASCFAAEKGTLRVNFLLKEDACTPAPDQLLTMEFRVKAPQLVDYVPANVFTPNSDGLNDYFELPSLPETFCTATFANIKIYNRWGKEVFSSTDKEFKWDGKAVNDGVYYYIIDYQTSTYKGSVTLIR